MNVFAYQVRDERGRIRRGTMEASSSDLLVERLRSSGYWITEVHEVQPGWLSLFTSHRLSLEMFALYLVQLASLLEAGISLPQALQVQVQQTRHPALVRATQDVLKQIQEGKTYSLSLKSHPKIFSSLFVHMVEAGEASGHLGETLMRLAGFMERDADTRQRLKGAMIYPAILTVLGLAVVFYLIVFVVPNFVEIYAESGMELPLPTRVLYHLGSSFQRWWFLVIGGVAAAVSLLTWFYRTPQGHFVFDRFILKVPIMGGLVEKVVIARFARTLGTLLKSGVPLLSSLAITQKVLNQGVYERSVEAVREAALRGESLAKPLRADGSFPPMVTQMIAVGEETGTLEQMLFKVADFYEKVSERLLKNLTSLIEPIFLVVIGVIVGFIFAAIMLPVFHMAKAMKRM